MDENSSKISDLIEKLEKDKITPKEIIKILDEKKLSEKQISKGGALGYLIWIVLCFLPTLAKYTQWKYINFLAIIPSFDIPHILIYISIAFFVAAISFTIWGSQYNIRKGGVHSEDYTIILFKNGPYRLLRHPIHLGWSVLFITIPLMVSRWAPFTILSIIGIIAVVSLHYYTSIMEERKLNIRKWGDAYRQYMREVPRWNIILGLVRLVRKR